ncbi:MAG: DoxX family protein [Cytophagales bacterium]|nr:DoxX family protein [Cytophagales bacterium]
MLGRIWSTKPIALDAGLLLIRLTVAVLMIPHGWAKFTHFAERADKFPDPLGVGSPVSLFLVISAELFCSVLLALGLFTRIVLVPLMIAMGVVVLVIHADDPVSKKEHALLFLIPYAGLFLTGPGGYSLDRLLKK